MLGKWLVGLLAVLGAGTAWAQSAPVGTIAQVRGAATATRAAGSVTLQLNTPVYSDDLLETEENAKILVQFTDGTRLTLGPSSEVLIDEFVFNAAGGTNNAAIRVTAGAMRLVAGAIGKVGGPQAINVATPVASIGVAARILSSRWRKATTCRWHCSRAMRSRSPIRPTRRSCGPVKVRISGGVRVKPQHPARR